MEIQIKENGLTLKLTANGQQTIDLRMIKQAYALVTGKIDDDTEPERLPIVDDLKPSANYKHDEQASKPAYHEPVKTALACPYCGLTKTIKVPFGYRFVNCPQCRERVFLQPASDDFGVPDEHGIYYKAEEIYQDREQQIADDELLQAMKMRKKNNDD
ncbi:hypothetical protein [uncultured Limosilactobacillus sp.]|uniref:hypothetical protein n=1 Tax=uncultured Limosilactobacillus sp. TaxID=2837629 RepID=UPI0025D9B5D0|nr:hypothetical protein [uncultured Limosilactobacillus sp.]